MVPWYIVRGVDFLFTNMYINHRRAVSHTREVGILECCIACGTLACCCLVHVVMIVIALAGGLGIAKIVMGAIYLHDCSIENRIPIWLIVSGCAPILFGGFGRQIHMDYGDGNNLCGTICGVIGCFYNLAWLICGSVWVYPNYSTVTAKNFITCTGNITTGCTQGNCDKNLITFAFVMATIDWIFMGFWIVLIGCLILRACKIRMSLCLRGTVFGYAVTRAHNSRISNLSNL